MSKPVNSRSKLLGFPKSYAFVVGINNYPKINANLKSAVNDARALAKVLKHRQGFDHVELLIDPHPEEDQESLRKNMEGIAVQLSANGAIFRDMLQRIQDPEQEPTINPQDCIVFYYAGHGKPGAFEEGPKGYLLPSDAQPEMAMLKNDSLIAMEEVFEALKKLDCHHTLLILDCCFAGKFRYADDSRMGRIGLSNMPLYEERFNRYKKEKAWQVIVSAGPNQTAADWLGQRQELTNGVHSPFAEALLEALEGKAELAEDGKKLGDGVLTSQELFLYLWNKVEKLTKDGHLGDKSQYPDLFPMANHQGGQFIFFDPNNKLNFAERELRNPYQGLCPFEPEANDLFFGRSAVIKELLERIIQTSLLVITAPSGSGKSSVAKAGLYPALRNWVDSDGQKSWADSELLVLRPGATPWTGQLTKRSDTDGQLSNHFNGLKPLLKQLDKSKKQLLLLDQYEELFTDGASTEEVNAFEENLISLFQSADKNQLKIVITLRSDYEWLLAKSTFGKVFWDLDQLNNFLYRLRAMSMPELREALVNPALAELYEFETDKLIETILSEVGHAPGALPMLSFLMSQYYEVANKDERVFTMPVYKELGGVNGALSKYADRIYQELSSVHRQVMQKLMLRMVKVSGGNINRRRVYVRSLVQDNNGNTKVLNEFDYLDHQDAMVEEVLQLLEKKQLILGGTDRTGAYYEPVHDALIQHWVTCKEWVAEMGVENLQLQRQLWQAVEDSSSSANRVDLKERDEEERHSNNFSRLWDTNPKLLQVLAQVSAGAQKHCSQQQHELLAEALPQLSEQDREPFRKLWEESHARGEMPDLNALILFGYSDKLLSIFLKKGDHWLNEEEVNFIQQSWEKRIEDILHLKQERDDAIQAKKEAQAGASTAKARAIYPKDNTLALNLAMAAHRLCPSAESKAAIQDIISDQKSIFYKKNFAHHSGAINAVLFSPDGNTILLGSADATASLLTPEGNLVQTFSGHSAGITSLAFSPDGKKILTGSTDQTIKLWTLDGVLLHTYQGEADEVRSVAFSPDGKHLISGNKNNTAQLWAIDGRLLHTFEGHLSLVCSLSFSPDGQSILTTANFARLWKITGEPIHVFEGHTSWVRSAAFSPDGESILCGRADGAVNLYHRSGKLIRAFEGHPNPILSVAFFPDGQSCLTGSVDGTAKWWGIDGSLRQTFCGHSDIVLSVAAAPDGQSIVTGSTDQTAKIWLLTSDLIHTFSGHKDRVSTVAFSPDGKTILTGSADATVKLWRTNGKLLKTLKGHKDFITDTVFSPDGQKILTASWDKTAKLWSRSGKLLHTFEGHTDFINGVAFSPDGQSIATASADGTTLLWTIAGKLIRALDHASHKITSVAFAPNGQTLVVGTEQKILQLWQINDGQLIQTFEGHTAYVSGVAFSPDGGKIISSSWDRTARVWLPDGTLALTIQAHKEYVNSAQYSPDGQFILTVSGDNVAKLWTSTGEYIRSFNGHKSYIVDLAFSPDNQFILTASFDGTAKLWKDNFADWENDEARWQRVYKMNAAEKVLHKIDWEY